MTQSKIKNQRRHLNWWQILLIIIGSVVALPFIIYGISALVYEISKPINKANFELLNANSVALYEKLKVASAGSEVWAYAKKCEPEMAGPWPTGSYFCETNISTVVEVTDTSRLTKLHEKYFPIVDSSDFITTERSIDQYPSSDFGLYFVYSVAEKQYLTNKGKMVCSYKLHLLPDEPLTDGYVQPTKDGHGVIKVGFNCVGKAPENWYNPEKDLF